MFLAWIETRAQSASECVLVEREFAELPKARLWVDAQLEGHGQATGNAAIFETEGPLARLAWETHGLGQRLTPRPERHVEQPQNRRLRQRLGVGCRA